MPLEAGRQLGPYEIVSAIGAGGMGEVYKARDTRLDRTVAIKVLPEHVAADPDLKQRFEREAKTISSLNHPHICTLYDIGSQDGIDFLVMEYLEGDTLAQRLEKGALPLDQALTVAIEIADALDKAHRQGITHRAAAGVLHVSGVDLYPAGDRDPQGKPALTRGARSPMQHRYVGDRNDFIKYALLRRILTALKKRSLGLNWYLADPQKVDPVGQADGRHVDYLLGGGGWRRQVDQALFDRLQGLLVRNGEIDEQARRTETIERSGLLGENAVYFAREVPTDLEKRRVWHQTAVDTLVNVDMVFLDPDNSPSSLYRSSQRGGKWAAPCEILDYARGGRPVMCISHPPRTPRHLHHDTIVAILGLRRDFCASIYLGSCGFHLLAPDTNKIGDAMYQLALDANRRQWGTCRYIDSEGRTENIDSSPPPAVRSQGRLRPGWIANGSARSHEEGADCEVGKDMTIKHALFKLSTVVPPNPVHEVAWHVENCKVHGYTDVACTRTPAGLIQAESRVDYYGDKKLGHAYLGGGVFWERLDLNGESGPGREALLASPLYSAQGYPETTKCMLRLVEFARAPEGTSIDALSGVRRDRESGRLVRLIQATVPRGNAGTFLNYWTHGDLGVRPGSRASRGEAHVSSNSDVERIRSLLEQRDEELRELKSRRLTKLRNIRRPMVTALFTALGVFEPVSDTIDFVAGSVTDQRSLCERLFELRDTGALRHQRRYGNKWFGVHFSTGQDDQGRLYFRQRTDRRFEVLVSNKKQQDKDLRHVLK